MLAAAQSIPAGYHETKSPVWKSPLGELRYEKGRCYFIRRGRCTLLKLLWGGLVEIGPQGRMLLQKYKGVPILWNTVYNS